jgi:hypothetical protein
MPKSIEMSLIKIHGLQYVPIRTALMSRFAIKLRVQVIVGLKSPYIETCKNLAIRAKIFLTYYILLLLCPCYNI